MLMEIINAPLLVRAESVAAGASLLAAAAAAVAAAMSFLSVRSARKMNEVRTIRSFMQVYNSEEMNQSLRD